MKFIFLTVLVYGIVPVFDKIAASSVDATVGMFVRSVAVLTFALIVMTITGKWSLTKDLTTQGIAVLSISGIMAGGIGVFAFLRSMQEVKDAGKVAVLTSTYPLLALVLTAIFFKESLTLWKFLGSLLITGGVILLNF